MKKLTAKLAAFNSNESGATMIEYALIAALISVVAITAMQSVGSEVSDQFDRVADDIAGAQSTN